MALSRTAKPIHCKCTDSHSTEPEVRQASSLLTTGTGKAAISRQVHAADASPKHDVTTMTKEAGQEDECRQGCTEAMGLTPCGRILICGRPCIEPRGHGGRPNAIWHTCGEHMRRGVNGTLDADSGPTESRSSEPDPCTKNDGTHSTQHGTKQPEGSVEGRPNRGAWPKLALAVCATVSGILNLESAGHLVSFVTVVWKCMALSYRATPERRARRPTGTASQRCSDGSGQDNEAKHRINLKEARDRLWQAAKKLCIYPSENGESDSSEQEEKRLDPVLNNAMVTYDEMCQRHRNRRKEITNEQLACHWDNLPNYRAPANIRKCDPKLNGRLVTKAEMCEGYETRGQTLSDEDAEDRWRELTETDGERAYEEPTGSRKYEWWSRSQLKFPEEAKATDLVKRLRMVFHEHQNKACPPVLMQTRYHWEVEKVLKKAGIPCDMLNAERMNIMTELPWHQVLMGTEKLEETDADPAERVATLYLSLAIEAYLRSQLGALENKTLFYADIVKLAWQANNGLLSDNEAAACLVLGMGRNFAAHTVDRVPEERRVDPMLDYEAVTFDQMRTGLQLRGEGLSEHQLQVHWSELQVLDEQAEQDPVAKDQQKMDPPMQDEGAPRAAPKPAGSDTEEQITPTAPKPSPRSTVAHIMTRLAEQNWDPGPAPRQTLTHSQIREEIRRRWLGAALRKNMEDNLREQGRRMREAQDKLAALQQETDDARSRAHDWLIDHHQAHTDPGAAGRAWSGTRALPTETWVSCVLNQLTIDRDILGSETWRLTQKCQDLQRDNDEFKTELAEARSRVASATDPAALLQVYYSPTHKQLWYSDGIQKSSWMSHSEQTAVAKEYEDVFSRRSITLAVQPRSSPSLTGGVTGGALAAAALSLTGCQQHSAPAGEDIHTANPWLGMGIALVMMLIAASYLGANREGHRSRPTSKRTTCWAWLGIVPNMSNIADATRQDGSSNNAHYPAVPRLGLLPVREAAKGSRAQTPCLKSLMPVESLRKNEEQRAKGQERKRTSEAALHPEEQDAPASWLDGMLSARATVKYVEPTSLLDGVHPQPNDSVRPC